MGGGRRIACACAWALASACGPTLVDGPEVGDSGSASASGTVSASFGDTTVADESSASVSDTATATATATATDTATATATATATDTATATATLTATLDDSGTGDGVSSSTISWVSCGDDGMIRWLVEVYVLGPIDDCVAPADLDPSDVLVVGIDGWDGEGGTFVLGDGAASATYNVQSLMGTFTLEVSAPYHPSTLTYDFANASAELTGDVSLEPCSHVEAPPCAAGTTG